MNDVILQMTGERLAEQEKVSGNGSGICGNTNSATANDLDIKQSLVMELELKAMNSWLKRDTANTDHLLKQAVEIEKAISYAYGPPTIVKPSFELYGEWLLEVNRPREASEQFQLSLKAAPKRALSLAGKQRAKSIMKDNAQLR
jgi:hypothetical protein